MTIIISQLYSYDCGGYDDNNEGNDDDDDDQHDDYDDQHDDYDDIVFLQTLPFYFTYSTFINSMSSYCTIQPSINQ